jgi:hypothetical protein
MARRPGCGRDVGGERGQLGAGPRGQRPARPRAELVPGQPALHERVLQRLDDQLAVGVARPEPVTARRCRVLRSRHYRHPSLTQCRVKRSAAVPWRPCATRIRQDLPLPYLVGARTELNRVDAVVAADQRAADE